MDVSSVLDGLNDVQRQAVSSPTGNLLVLAGAGSGKTRVLVHRIAWYIQAEKVSPFGILAVTFTNKAAAEMRSRIESLLKRPPGGMWVGTFHGIAHRLLRKHWHEAKLPENFQIIAILTRFIKPFSIFFPKKIREMISFMPLKFPKKTLPKLQIYKSIKKKTCSESSFTNRMCTKSYCSTN